jgi:hypothetical protein
MGYQTNAMGDYSTALGVYADANHNNSYVIGLDAGSTTRCESSIENQFKVCGDTSLEGELCLNGDCISDWSTASKLEDYNIVCTAPSFGGACSVSCAPGFVLTSWECTDHLGGYLPGGICIQGVTEGSIIDTVSPFGCPDSHGDCVGNGVCSRL